MAEATKEKELPTLFDISVELARRDLAEYFELARGFKPAPHQKKILDKLNEFLIKCWSTPPGKHDKLRVLTINLPPGAGKSSIISSTLPAWVLGQRPKERIGIISAQGTLSGLFENTIKADIEEGEIYKACFPEEEARPDKSRGWAKGTLYLKGLPRGEATPSLVAAGLFGSVLGRRFTMLVLDDPQDQATTRTPEQRDMSWNFLDATVLSRVIPGSPVICVQQRWHEDDVTGRLLRYYDADQVEVSAIIEEEDGTKSSYWPGMYSVDYLEQRRISNPHMFQANYQQQPGLGDGDIFKREYFRYYTRNRNGNFMVQDDMGYVMMEPAKGMYYQSWDTAFKKGEDNDYSSCIEAVVDPITRDIFVTRVFWERLDFPELLDKAKDFYSKTLPRYVLVEDKASGTSLVQTLRAQSGLPIKPVKVEKDKVNRARSTTGYFDTGKVFFDRNDPKIPEFENFLTGFPFMLHDDPVDALVQLINEVIIGDGFGDFAIG